MGTISLIDLTLLMFAWIPQSTFVFSFELIFLSVLGFYFHQTGWSWKRFSYWVIGFLAIWFVGSFAADRRIRDIFSYELSLQETWYYFSFSDNLMIALFGVVLALLLSGLVGFIYYTLKKRKFKNTQFIFVVPVVIALMPFAAEVIVTFQKKSFNLESTKPSPYQAELTRAHTFLCYKNECPCYQLLIKNPSGNVVFKKDFKEHYSGQCYVPENIYISEAGAIFWGLFDDEGNKSELLYVDLRSQKSIYCHDARESKTRGKAELTAQVLEDCKVAKEFLKR